MAHCRYPAFEATTLHSVSEPGSIGVAMNAQSRAVVMRGSRAIERDVPPDSVGLCGPEPIHWLRTHAPSEIVEITATRGLRLSIAEAMGVARHADLDDLHGWHDPVVLAGAMRLRAHCHGWTPLPDLARDELVRTLYAHVYRARFGGRWPTGGPAVLDARRLDRVVAFMQAHLGDELTIDRLAGVVGLSPFHFVRAFKGATGVPPHRFVGTLRLHRAEAQLRRGQGPVERIANELGFENLSHFRRLFRAHAGTVPSLVRHRSAPTA